MSSDSTASSEARAQIGAARSLVVKIGTAVLTGGSDELDRAYLHDLAATIAQLRAGGRRVVVVSSGAVGAGVGVLRLRERPTDVGVLQAAAAAGQPKLMSLWAEALGVRSTPAAQILLSRGDFDSRERYLNIRNCVGALHALGAVPIVNENDTVATEEISLGDNDVLAARVAVAVQAEALVLLTTAPGVLDEDDQVVPFAGDAADLARLVRPARTKQGRGGMATKVEACRIAGEGGVSTVIAPGRPVETLARVLEGQAIGTCVGAGVARVQGRRQWIALSATPAGTLDLDAGASVALRERNASLLAKGVRAVEGRFRMGDVVLLRDPEGAEVGRGLVNLASEELRAVKGLASSEFERVLGRRVHEEVVHRDNLVITRR